ncbi:hypothetical protein BDY21DRAFT_347692 [Lineolata rhizophorae]|uniref:RNase P subunit Pop3-domain-containing protein n=1 Tax=Lineolata rhizophorae TaxID=578093 RepID=A0A6A6NY27_9PEZI|nr:hypothetical protein BDY21DRAFT_347692 [Lineolata rhizophorae]
MTSRANPRPKAPAPVFKVDSPFVGPSWPHVSLADQHVTLNMLCSLLAPIGQYRKNRVVPSKGKRARKRKKRIEAAQDPAASASIPASRPHIESPVEIGLNSVSRRLELLAAQRRPSDESNNHLSDRHIAVVFLPKSKNDMIYSHLPLLSRTASLGRPDNFVTRLVPLSPMAEDKLSAALNLPRVGVVGVLEDAPQAGPLIEFVRAHVAAVEVPWLKDVADGSYKNPHVQHREASARSNVIPSMTP